MLHIWTLVPQHPAFPLFLCFGRWSGLLVAFEDTHELLEIPDRQSSYCHAANFYEYMHYARVVQTLRFTLIFWDTKSYTWPALLESLVYMQDTLYTPFACARPLILTVLP